MIQIPCVCTIQRFGRTAQNVEDRSRLHRSIRPGTRDEHFLQRHSVQPLQNQKMPERLHPL